ncbi:hypothetical protein [Candidatus Igneacidithiobacillus taiwanensis]|uniref:hypothetical protein n=1 Tax=Candidatus Igneacidithiobacillus taiwanensis TaxID=1945924 RepID=UPI0028964EEE|nr:hypothetical protein [Candidatus Igneacidithiobacillus taiwanensis]
MTGPRRPGQLAYRHAIDGAQTTLRLERKIKEKQTLAGVVGAHGPSPPASVYTQTGESISFREGRTDVAAAACGVGYLR